MPLPILYLCWFKSYSWKMFYPKTSIFTMFYLWRLYVDLTSIVMMFLSKDEFKSYRLLFHAFFYYHNSWDNGMFSEKYNDISQILTFDDLWWPQYCSKMKNDWNTFKRTNWELSTVFYRVFPALLVFELEMGGNICLYQLWRSWMRLPLGRGLKIRAIPIFACHILL